MRMGLLTVPSHDGYLITGYGKRLQRRPDELLGAPGTASPENLDGLPEDDNLNVAMLALDVLENHGRVLATEAVPGAWLAGLPGRRVFTARQPVCRNLLLGDCASRTALKYNPFREWIGAQIRTDGYGWGFPGQPADAARPAWRTSGSATCATASTVGCSSAPGAPKTWSATTSTMSSKWDSRWSLRDPVRRGGPVRSGPRPFGARPGGMPGVVLRALR